MVKSNQTALPLEIVQGATEKEMAKGLLMAHPELQTAFDAFKAAMADSGEKYRSLMRELHKAQLGPKEQTAVLTYWGFNKSRVSEIKQIVNNSDANFDRFISGEVSFRLALDAARRGKTSGGGGSHEAGKNLEKRIADALSPVGIKVRKACVAWVTLEQVEIKMTIKPRKVAVSPNTEDKK